MDHRSGSCVTRKVSPFNLGQKRSESSAACSRVRFLLSSESKGQGFHYVSAWARSAIRSSASSMPTARRSRLGGTPVAAPSIVKRCSITLSVPPSEVARAISRSRPATASVAARRPSPETTSDRRSRRPSGAAPRRAGGGSAGRDRAPARSWGGPRGSARSRAHCRTPGARAARACAGRAAAARPRTGRAGRRRRGGRPGSPPSGHPAALVTSTPATHVAVAVQVLGRRVHDQIGAERERPREDRGRRGAVDRE